MNTLRIVCAKCKWDQFRLHAAQVDAKGRGTVRPQCARCGSLEYAGIDAAAGELPGRSMTLESIPL